MSLFSSALLVEDEPSLATALKISLRKLGVPVRHASTMREANRLYREEKPDFLLLDRALPDGDGLELCTSLRNEGFEGVILILTAAGSTQDRVAGLNRGADDYLAKPFSWEELDARVNALARRRPPVTQIWDLDAERLRIRGPLGWKELTPLEYRLATHLISAKGAIVSRDALLKDVWGFTLLPKTRTVDHFLGRLRKNFELNAEEPKHFLTVRGAGYRFQG